MRMRVSIGILILVLISVALVPLTGCDKHSLSTAPNSVPDIPSGSSGEASLKATNAVAAEISIYTYEVVNTYPPDPGAFTRGLVFLGGELLESTGLNGESSLRKVDLKTGRVLKRVEVPA